MKQDKRADLNTEDKQVGLAGSYPFIPQQERARVKREALLASGRRLFKEKGYEQTTAKEIAADAGVATGTFYRYFHDKRQLLLELLEDKIDHFLPPEPDWNKVDPVSYLADRLKAHFDEMDKIGLYHVLPELMQHDAEVAGLIQKGRKSLYNRILQGIRSTQKERLAWDDLDPETVAESIMLLVEHARKITGDKGGYTELARVICRMVSPFLK